MRDNQDAIRDWFKAALAHSGMSQAAVAREIWDGDRSIPNKILLGKREVRIEELAQIEQVTGYAPFRPITRHDDRPLRPPPPRTERKLHIAEWREHSEISEIAMAKALGVDQDTYGFLESKPHKFTIEQAEAAAKKMRIDFEQLWWPPAPIETPVKPARKKAAKRH